MSRVLTFILLLVWILTFPNTTSAEEAAGAGVEAAVLQDARIKQWLPRCHAKLVQRKESLRVVVLGDRVAAMEQSPPNRGDIEQAWHWRFLEYLSSHYYLTGGVRPADAKGKLKAVAEAAIHAPHDDEEDGPQPAEPLNFDTAGAAVFVANHTRLSATATEAITALTTDALDYEPELVILNYGLSDFSQGVSPLNYGKALREAIRICQSKRVDVIVAGPALMLGKDERLALGYLRPYASVAQELAAEMKVFFVDLGAAQLAMSVDPTLPRSTQGYDLVLPYLRRQFEHPGVQDLATPNASSHRIMAEAAWQQLSSPSAPDPISVDATLTLPGKPAGSAELQLTFHAASGSKDGLQEIAMGVLGLDRIWMPQTIDGAPGGIGSSNIVEGWKQSVACVPQFPGGPYMLVRADLPLGEEAAVRGSLLVSEGTTARLINYRAAVLPLNVSFPLGRLEGLTTELPLAVTVHNASAEPFNGTAEVLWRGRTESFPVTFNAGQAVPVTLKLPLPPAQSSPTFKSQLTLRLKRGAEQYDFTRELEASPDLLLTQKVPLLNRATAVADKPAPSTDAEHVNLTCLADASGLYFLFDLPTVDVNRKRTAASAKIEVTIDARGPAERGKLGHCEFLTLQVPWVDGPITLDKVAFGSFGPGYDRTLEPRFFLASVTTLRENRRQGRLSIPSSYFYLHDWDLKGARQSTLGLNVQVQLLHFADDNAPGAYVIEKTFSLVSPGLPRNDAQSLGVLNLARKPATWSVRIY